MRKLVDGAYVDMSAGEIAEHLAGDIGVLGTLEGYAARKRWEKEVGGIEVAGTTVYTDDRSKMMIMGARIAAEADPGFATQWKAADGSFVEIDAATIIAISDAVLAHVDACFAIEAQVLDGIGNETITSTAEIDAAFAA